MHISHQHKSSQLAPKYLPPNPASLPQGSQLPFSNLAMSSIGGCNFLEVFPPEILNKIYEHVLHSPSRRIELYPYRDGRVDRAPLRFKIFTKSSLGSPRQEIRLSFLRTCKKIHADCKDMFWAQNILNITTLTSQGTFRLLPQISKYKVMAVEMDVDDYQVDLYSLQDILEEIQRWMVEGSLKSFAARGIYMAWTRTDLGAYLAWVRTVNEMMDEQL